jgi:hypothetical protein
MTNNNFSERLDRAIWGSERVGRVIDEAHEKLPPLLGAVG